MPSDESKSRIRHILGKLIDAIYVATALFGAYCAFGGFYILINDYPASTTVTHAVGFIAMGSFLFLAGNYSYHFSRRRLRPD